MEFSGVEGSMVIVDLEPLTSVCVDNYFPTNPLNDRIHRKVEIAFANHFASELLEQPPDFWIQSIKLSELLKQFLVSRCFHHQVPNWSV